MNARETGTPPRRGWRTRTFWAIVVLLLLVSSFGYGFLVYSRHLFPYRLLRRAHHAIPPSGHVSGGHAKPAPPSLDAIRHLANLPYLEGYRPPTAGGVIRAYDRARSEDGLNFFTSAGAPVATLMDMDGRVVKSWTADAQKAIPGIRIGERQRGARTVPAGRRALARRRHRRDVRRDRAGSPRFLLPGSLGLARLRASRSLRRRAKPRLGNRSRAARAA